MSEESTAVTSQHFEYIASHTSGDDAFLKSLKEAARSTDIPNIWISPEQAGLLQILLKLCGAREVIEVGTLAGYSAIVLARALPENGRVRTIEINESYADFAEQWIARSDVAGRIEVLRGAGKDVLPTLPAESADAALIDADKGGYKLYLKECLRILRPTGLILADNAFAFGELFDEHPKDPDTPAVRAFNEHMCQMDGLHSIIVPLGDGCWVGVKTPQAIDTARPPPHGHGV